MMRSDPEAFQNESKFGPIPGITVGAIWNTRQVLLEALSRDLLTGDAIAGMSVQRPGSTSIPRLEFPVGGMAPILSSCLGGMRMTLMAETPCVSLTSILLSAVSHPATERTQEQVGVRMMMGPVGEVGGEAAASKPATSPSPIRTTMHYA